MPESMLCNRTTKVVCPKCNQASFVKVGDLVDAKPAECQNRACGHRFDAASTASGQAAIKEYKRELRALKSAQKRRAAFKALPQEEQDRQIKPIMAALDAYRKRTEDI